MKLSGHSEGAWAWAVAAIAAFEAGLSWTAAVCVFSALVTPTISHVYLEGKL